MSDQHTFPRLPNGYPAPQGLYDPAQERDACGVGFIADMHGRASYDILDGAITALKNLAHRGAIDADAVTGDGAGVLTQLPYEIFLPYLEERGIALAREDLAVGMVFLPRGDIRAVERGRAIVEEGIKREGLRFLAWREVPVDHSCLGRKAETTRPLIVQAFIGRPEGIIDAEYERRLLLAQKFCTRVAEAENMAGFYVVSMSSRTITYKGLLNSPQVRKFFLDLKSPRFKTAYAIFHQRFATNTFPDWNRAQPFRMLAHNGEINTVRGNRNSMKAREYSSDHGVWGDRFKDLAPMVQEDMSDSASFDNCLQLMTVGGRSIINGVSIMMPTAWEENKDMPEAVRDFYKYHAAMMEPWDGPAAVVFTDGRFVGSSLDRNGLRPARFQVWEDGTVVLASEVGLIPKRDSKVVRAGRLGPGRMMVVDLQEHVVIEDEALKARLGQENDYAAWCRQSIHSLQDNPPREVDYARATTDPAEITARRVAYGYDLDEEKMILRPMIESGKEPIGSMGEDTPLAVLSRRPRLLFSYFKQLVAQVTNPAIDSLRERLVMSLKMTLGGRLSLFEGAPTEHRFVALESPLLLDHEFEALQQVDFLADKLLKVDITFPVKEGPDGLGAAIKRIRAEVRACVESRDCRLVILSDRALDARRAAVPSLLAVGAAHSELVKLGQRIRCDVLCETGEVRDVHQFGCVITAGANAVYPYFALDVIRKIVSEPAAGEDEKDTPAISVEQAILNYRKGIDAGLLKIMSKMGISTLFSYQGAKIFEAIGISQKVVDELFVGVYAPIGGVGYKEIAIDVLRRHAEAFPLEGAAALWSEGYYKDNKKDPGEYHAWSTKFVSGMNTFIRKQGSFESFKDMRDAADVHVPTSPRDLMRLRYSLRQPVPLAEVESIEDIRRRFTTAAMSLGALSPEMHETLAIAMNRIGGKSNSGEGG
ncbi:MAG: glutamate synthase central domain-containing protein, partial [Opitutales bacterium]